MPLAPEDGPGDFWAHKAVDEAAQDAAGCPGCGAAQLHQGRCLTCEPPTAGEVADAKARLDRLGPSVRPMYRQDWERRTGGRGPTVAEHGAEIAYRSEANDGIGRARREYEVLRDAYDASDKSKDARDGYVDCRNCGHRFDSFEHGSRCPSCAVEN